MGKKKGNPPGADDLRKRAEARVKPQDAELKKLAKEDPLRLIHELRVHQIELEMQNEQLRASQHELEESWARYSDLYDFAPVGYLVLDKEGLIVEANLTAAGILAVERAFLKGKPFDRFVREGSKNDSCAHRKRVFDNGTTEDAELRLIQKGGGTFFVHLHSQPVKDAEGNIIQCRSSIIDITARKEAEAKIHEMARFPEENPNPVMRADADGMVLYANTPGADLLADMGWKKGSPLPAEFLKPVRQAVQEGRVEEFEFICPSQRVFAFAVSSVGGRDVHIYGRNITAAAADRTALRESQMDLNRAQAVAHVGSWRMDVQKNELTWSDENYWIFGRPKGEPQTYETFLACVHPDDRKYVDKKWQAGLRGEDYDIEHRLLVDGKVRWVREKAYLEFDDDWNLVGGFGITQDITERKLAEDALRQAKDDWENTFNTVPDLIGIFDTHYRITRVNRAMAERLGKTAEECVGLTCFEAVHGTGEPPDFCPHALTLLDGKEHTAEIHEPRLGGDFLVSTTPVFDEQGRVIASIHVARDITERKKAEEELRASNEELSRFNRVAVGREIRIIEMKKEVNELCARLGEGRRYPLEFLKENEKKETDNGKKEA